MPKTSTIVVWKRRGATDAATMSSMVRKAGTGISGERFE